MAILRPAPILLAAVALASCNQKASDQPPPAGTEAAASPSPDDPVANAERAAPASVSRAASIVTVGADGKMTELRKGTNGWTCMPDSPTTPGPDAMCMDPNATAWAMAWMNHKTPPNDTPGMMYMLAGGTDASNTDPYATKPTEGSDWIHTGPHMMLVGSQAALKGYPSGTNPDVKAPYVMWAGTPYAHLMIPVS